MKIISLETDEQLMSSSLSSIIFLSASVLPLRTPCWMTSGRPERNIRERSWQRSFPASNSASITLRSSRRTSSWTYCSPTETYRYKQDNNWHKQPCQKVYQHTFLLQKLKGFMFILPPGLWCHGEAGADFGDAANLWSGHPTHDPVPLLLCSQQVTSCISWIQAQAWRPIQEYSAKRRLGFTANI